MASAQFILISMLISVAYVHATVTESTNDLQRTKDREERTLIEVPIIGTIIMITSKVCGLVTSLLGYKFAALSVLTSISTWIYQNLFSVIIGTVVVLGVCSITGLPTLFSVTPELEMDHRLLLAARSLENGYRKYGNTR